MRIRPSSQTKVGTGALALPCLIVFCVHLPVSLLTAPHKERAQDVVDTTNSTDFQFLRERKSEAQLMARAAAVARKYEPHLLPPTLNDLATNVAGCFLVCLPVLLLYPGTVPTHTRLSEPQAPPMFVKSMLPPLVFSFCNGLSFIAWVRSAVPLQPSAACHLSTHAVPPLPAAIKAGKRASKGARASMGRARHCDGGASVHIRREQVSHTHGDAKHRRGRRRVPCHALLHHD